MTVRGEMLYCSIIVAFLFFNLKKTPQQIFIVFVCCFCVVYFSIWKNDIIEYMYYLMISFYLQGALLFRSEESIWWSKVLLCSDFTKGSILSKNSCSACFFHSPHLVFQYVMATRTNHYRCPLQQYLSARTVQYINPDLQAAKLILNYGVGYMLLQTPMA